MKPWTRLRRRTLGWYVRLGILFQSPKLEDYNYWAIPCQFAVSLLWGKLNSFGGEQALKGKKKRLDVLLVEREMVESRAKAQALIMAGEVSSGGRVVTKPGTVVSTSACISIREKPPFVGRGGIKLAHALKEFGVNPEGLTGLDVGASTGGFTDCLLKRGARRVYALDVGRGQLDYGLRQDDRVVVMERVNAHYAFEMPERVDVATVDVSFISLTRVLPNVLAHLEPWGSVVALVKPQFEAKRREVGKGGVVRDPLIHARVLGRMTKWVAEAGLRLRSITPSPILGAAGNREFFMHLGFYEDGR